MAPGPIGTSSDGDNNQSDMINGAIGQSDAYHWPTNVTGGQTYPDRMTANFCERIIADM
jgi:hypothetical protein